MFQPQELTFLILTTKTLKNKCLVAVTVWSLLDGSLKIHFCIKTLTNVKKQMPIDGYRVGPAKWHPSLYCLWLIYFLKITFYKNAHKYMIRFDLLELRLGSEEQSDMRPLTLTKIKKWVSVIVTF